MDFKSNYLVSTFDGAEKSARFLSGDTKSLLIADEHLKNIGER